MKRKIIIEIEQNHGRVKGSAKVIHDDTITWERTDYDMIYLSSILNRMRRDLYFINKECYSKYKKMEKI